MAELWHFRTTAGAACGPGDRETLSQAVGATPSTKVLDGTGDTWNRTESVRTIAAGNWQVVVDYDSDSGGGPGNEIDVIVERRNSSCVIQQTIINETLAVDKGQTAATVSTSNVNPGAVTFASGDILTLTITQTRGNQTITLRYNGTLNNTSDSQLNHPSPNGFADVSWVEVQAVSPHGQGQISWTELQVPNAGVSSQGQVSWTELETPDVAGQGQISWTEFEIPNVAGRGHVSWTELEVPNLAGQGQVSWSEFETPDIAGQGQISWTEFEIPDAGRRGQISWAELEVPNPDGRGHVAWTEFEVPNAGGVQGRSQISWVELETPNIAPNSAANVGWVQLQTPDVDTIDRAALISWAELKAPNVNPGGTDGSAELAFAEFEVEDPKALQITRLFIETPEPRRRGRIYWARVEFPSVLGTTRQQKIAIKDFNRELFLQELDAYSLKPTKLFLPGFNPTTGGTDPQRIWTPKPATSVQFGEVVQPGTMWLDYSFVLTAEDLFNLQFVCHRHNATITTENQDDNDQFRDDLVALRDYEPRCEFLTQAEKDDLLCRLLRFVMRMPTETLERRIQGDPLTDGELD